MPKCQAVSTRLPVSGGDTLLIYCRIDKSKKNCLQARNTRMQAVLVDVKNVFKAVTCSLAQMPVFLIRICRANVLRVSKRQSVTWPEFLQSAMEAKGYRTAAALSRASGITESLISRWMRGSTQPDIPTLRRLAKSLDVPLLELLVVTDHLEPGETKLQARPEPPRALTFEEMLERLNVPASDKDALRALYRGLRLERGEPVKKSRRS